MIAPVVLLLILCTLDLGLGVYTYNSLSEAARYGARYASVRGKDSKTPLGPRANNAAVTTAVQSVLIGVRTSELTVASTWIDNDNRRNSRVRVDLTYDHYPVMLSVFGKGPIKLRATSTMTITN